jgi:hypothetical protein
MRKINKSNLTFWKCDPYDLFDIYGEYQKTFFMYKGNKYIGYALFK